MENLKSDGEVLSEVYRNANLALTSIADILPQIDDESIKEEILTQHEGYEHICSQAVCLAEKLNLELKQPSPIKKAMMWSAIKMNAAGDNSTSNIAQMMIRGTTTGITSLKVTQSQGNALNSDVKKLLKDLIKQETDYQKRLDKFL
jgi:hypothetical protein